MSLDSYYRSNPGRWLEVVCGVAIGVFALLALGLSAFLVVRARLGGGVLTAVLLLAGLGYWLARLAFRLFLGESRTVRPLLSPVELIVGASILGLGGMLLLFIAVTEHDLNLVVPVLGILPVPYYAWRFARERRRQVTPDKSFEPTRMANVQDEKEDRSDHG